MKPSSGNKHYRRRRELILRRLVRHLRDWLNGFIEEAESVTAEAGMGAPSAGSSRSNDSDARAERADAPGATALGRSRQHGAPEDWLKRVREGAPELLQRLDESPTASFAPPQSPIERAQSHEEPVAAQARQFQPSGSPGARATGLPMPHAVAESRPSSWLQSLKTRLRPSIFRLEREAAAARHEREQATIGAAPRTASTVLIESAAKSAANSSPPDELPAAQRSESHSTQSSRECHVASRAPSQKILRFNEAEPLWQSSRLLRDAAAKSQDPRAGFGLHDRKAGGADSLVVSAQLHQVRESAHEAAPDTRPETKKVNVSSEGLATPSAPTEAGSNQRNLAMNFPTVRSDTRPATGELTPFGQFDHQPQESSWANVFDGVSSRDSQNATQPFDPWPALPEYPKDSVGNLTKALRDAERVRAVELEQQGGR
jgi:hypothetical protein